MTQLSHAAEADAWDRVTSGVCDFVHVSLCVCVCASTL